MGKVRCIHSLGYDTIWHPLLDLSHIFGTVRHWRDLCLVSDVGNSNDTSIVGRDNTIIENMEFPITTQLIYNLLLLKIGTNG